MEQIPVSALPPALRQRQEALVARARRLERRLGDPVNGLAALFDGLPAEDDAFWVETQEVERWHALNAKAAPETGLRAY